MKKRGFTLIELMVSVAIFSIVMVIALGALLSISTADRKAETIGAVMNNLNFAVESMTRNIRTGVDYHCVDDASGDCTSGGSYFKFTSATGDAVSYSYSNDLNTCQQPANTTAGCIVRVVNGGSPIPITAPEVVITNVSDINNPVSGLTFYLRGATLGSLACGVAPATYACDNTQPSVVITVTGYLQISPTQQSQFALQTSVTQRLYDR